MLFKLRPELVLKHSKKLLTLLLCLPYIEGNVALLLWILSEIVRVVSKEKHSKLHHDTHLLAQILRVRQKLVFNCCK